MHSSITPQWTHTFLFDFDFSNNTLGHINVIDDVNRCNGNYTAWATLTRENRVNELIADVVVNIFCDNDHNVDTFVNELRAKLNSSLADVTSTIVKGIPQNKHVSIGRMQTDMFRHTLVA